MKKIEQIAQAMALIQPWKKGNSLSLDEILTVCNAVFGIEKEILLKKVSYHSTREKFAQYAFFWGVHYYTNINSFDLPEFTGTCSPKAVNRGIYFINTRIKHKSRSYHKILEFVSACEQRCPDRLYSILRLKRFNNNRCVDAEPKWRLFAFQVKEIPLHPMHWFKRDAFGKRMLGYSLHEPTCKSILLQDGEMDSEHLFALQRVSYRFILESEHEKYKTITPTPLDLLEAQPTVELLLPLDKHRLQ